MMSQNVRTSDDVSQYFKLTYLYMVLGLLTTGLTTTITGMFFAPTLLRLMQSSIFWIVVILIQLSFAFVVSAVAFNKNKAIALSGFLVFTAFEGVIIAPLLVFSKPLTVVAAFLSAAVLFVVMAVLGFTTKLDMSRFGGILIAATLAIIIASIVNLFLGSGMFSLILSAIVILVFSAWTAYDNQKLRVTFAEIPAEQANSVAIIGAFDLYLDFINMFINLLNLFSSRD